MRRQAFFRHGARGEIVMGDVITAVNDQPVAKRSDVLSAKKYSSAGPEKRVVSAVRSAPAALLAPPA